MVRKVGMKMESNNENMIEFISGSHMATLSFTNRKHITRMKKLYESNKDDFKYFVENQDGSICCKVPLKWIKISPPKQVSDEQRQAASERFKKMREDGLL